MDDMGKKKKKRRKKAKKKAIKSFEDLKKVAKKYES